METQDFKVGMMVKIVDHRDSDINGFYGTVTEVKKHIILVEINFADFTECVNCMAHELVLDKG